MEYVRWTLNRNMKSYVSLIDSGRININTLIDNIEPIKNAKRVYSAFEKKNRPISTLFKYTPKNEIMIRSKIPLIKKNLELLPRQ